MLEYPPGFLMLPLDVDMRSSCRLHPVLGFAIQAVELLGPGCGKWLEACALVVAD